MSAEIQWRGSETGVTLYATIRSKTGTQWNAPNFEAVTAANWTDYDTSHVSNKAIGRVAASLSPGP